MALKINKELTTRDGGKVEKGSIVTFQVTIPPTANEIHFDLFIYRNEEAVKDKTVGPIQLKEFGQFGIVSKVSVKDIIKLTYSDYINILKKQLESIEAIGNKCIEIVDLETIKVVVPIVETAKPKKEVVGKKYPEKKQQKENK